MEDKDLEKPEAAEETAVLVTSMPTSTPLRSFSDSSSQTFFSFSLISVFIFLLFITLIY